MKRPKWIHPFLKDEDLKKIEDAVTEVEKSTSGELVPVIVRQSSTVGHVPLILTLLLALFFYVFDLIALQENWLQGPHILWIGLDIIIILLAAKLLAPLSIVERLLTSRSDQEQQVAQRALLEFHQLQVDKTQDATGILLFVSLMEHQAVVLGDKNIASKLSQDDWQRVVELLIQGVKKKDLATGFVDAINESGKLLSQHFPIQEGDINELHNQLIIKE